MSLSNKMLFILQLLHNQQDGEQIIHVQYCQKEKLIDGKQGFPREDPNAPRMRIVAKQCPTEYQTYLSCLEANASNPDACKPFKQELFDCGRPGFKKANTDKNYEY